MKWLALSVAKTSVDSLSLQVAYDIQQGETSQAVEVPLLCSA